MRLEFEYGHGTMEAQLPDSTDIFIPGETVKDPDYIPEDKLEEAYLNSLADPIGMPRLSELAHKGTTVTIIVPDRVKGGEQPTSHRKLSINIFLTNFIMQVLIKRIFFLLFLMDFIPEVQKQMLRQFLVLNYLMNSGIQGRLSVMTVKTKSI